MRTKTPKSVSPRFFLPAGCSSSMSQPSSFSQLCPSYFPKVIHLVPITEWIDDSMHTTYLNLLLWLSHWWLPYLYFDDSLWTPNICSASPLECFKGISNLTWARQNYWSSKYLSKLRLPHSSMTHQKVPPPPNCSGQNRGDILNSSLSITLYIQAIHNFDSCAFGIRLCSCCYVLGQILIISYFETAIFSYLVHCYPPI